MRRHRLPARILPLVRLVGPYGWMAAGLVGGALLARSYLRRTSGLARSRDHAVEVSRWESEGGASGGWGRS